jgi:hypothetical protein
MIENIRAGANINAGDGGYSLGTQEKYDKFVKGRNQSLGKARIKELMSEAGTDTSGKWMGIEHAEKFAELIVKETMQVVANQLPSNQYLDVAHAVIEHYKEH